MKADGTGTTEIFETPWKQLVGATGKKGLNALKKLKHVGLVVAAFTLINSGPKAAAAEALGITPSGVDALLEGNATIGLQFWDPTGSAKQAQLLDGSVVREGDDYYWAEMCADGLVGHVKADGPGTIGIL